MLRELGSDVEVAEGNAPAEVTLVKAVIDGSPALGVGVEVESDTEDFEIEECAANVDTLALVGLMNHDTLSPVAVGRRMILASVGASSNNTDLEV